MRTGLDLIYWPQNFGFERIIERISPKGCFFWLGRKHLGNKQSLNYENDIHFASKSILILIRAVQNFALLKAMRSIIFLFTISLKETVKLPAKSMYLGIYLSIYELRYGRITLFKKHLNWHTMLQYSTTHAEPNKILSHKILWIWFQWRLRIWDRIKIVCKEINSILGKTADIVSIISYRIVKM